MNIIQQLLTTHAMKLESDSKKLEQIRAWYSRVASLSTAPYLPWDEFKELEEILGPDPSKK